MWGKIYEFCTNCCILHSLFLHRSNFYLHDGTGIHCVLRIVWKQIPKHNHLYKRILDSMFFPKILADHAYSKRKRRNSNKRKFVFLSFFINQPTLQVVGSGGSHSTNSMLGEGHDVLWRYFSLSSSVADRHSHAAFLHSLRVRTNFSQ